MLMERIEGHQYERRPSPVTTRVVGHSKHFVYVEHCLKGLPIKLVTSYRTKTITAHEALQLAICLGAYADAALKHGVYSFPNGKTDLLEFCLPISPVQAIVLSQRLLRSAECEMSSDWQ